MVNGMNKVLLALIVSFFSFELRADQIIPDSTDIDSVYFRRFEKYQILDDSLPDSPTFKFINVHRNIFENNDLPYMGLSNTGQAVYKGVIDMDVPTDLAYGVYPGFFPYLSRPEGSKYYRNKPPYTSIYYVSGSKKEEMIDLLHARNLGDNLNLSLHLIKGASEGFFNNVVNSWSHFDLDFNYSTSNHRYTILGGYYYNKKKVNENGGFVDFSTVRNPETVGSSRLSNAWNEIREEGLSLSQSLGLGKKAGNDSPYIKPWLRIGHDFKFSEGYRYYFDKGDINLETGRTMLNTDVYPNVYFDSNLTRDSIVHAVMTNQGNIWLYAGGQSFKFFFRHELTGYDQRKYVDTIYQNTFAGAAHDYSVSDLRLRSEFMYGLSGYRKGDVELSSILSKPASDSTSWAMQTGFYYYLLEPLFPDIRYTSNNFIWSKHFQKREKIMAEISLSKGGYSFTARAGSFNKLIYYDESASPHQADRRVSFLSGNLRKLLNWNKFYLDNNVTYQAISNHDLMPLPQFLARECFYFQSSAFEKVLTYQLGTDLYIYSYHYGYAYMPATNRFHLQSSQRLGGYPYFDIFLNFRLKRAFFFFKMQHFNKGMAGPDFFRVPGYPYPPRSFKFGLRWTLLN